MRPGTLQVLVAAMDEAEQRHESIPCKQEPGLWTNDLLTTRSIGAERVIDAAVTGCLYCPVLAECRAYMADRNANPATQLYGVVAGQVTSYGHTRQLIPPRRSL